MIKVFVLIVLTLLISGCAVRESFPVVSRSSDANGAVLMANGDDVKYYKTIKEEIKTNILSLYMSYGRREDQGIIAINFTVTRDGKLDPSSVVFLDDSVDNQILKNFVFLGLHKSFPVKPFPKSIFKKTKTLTFKLTIDFRNTGILLKRKLKPYETGIRICNIDENIRKIYGADIQEGVFVTEIFDDSPAFRAGLRVGDIIYSANDTKINNIHHLIDFLRKTSGDIKFMTNRGEFLVKKTCYLIKKTLKKTCYLTL